MAENNRYRTVIVPNVILLRSTEKAGLYEDEEGEQFWIPFSQLKEDSCDRDNEFGDIRIPAWLAEEKELEYEEED